MAEAREDKISGESSAGKALADHEVGGSVEIRTPSRTSYLTYRIDNIINFSTVRGLSCPNLNMNILEYVKKRLMR